jgi:acetyl-CoA carboxylase biotin carboxyl carrier protein
MNLEEIKDLIKLVSKTGIGKVQIESEGFKVTIKGGSSNSGEQQIIVQAPTQPYVAAPVAAPVVASAPVAPATPAAPVATESDDSKYVTIKSPMIGTFYRTPGPDKDAFVNVGSNIQPGDKLCIIEAMKTFNEIEAEISGKIIKVLVDNATPVDYDQPLFLVDPA